MPTVITQGAGSAQGFGFAARSTAANYIEDVFSTYLYTGNGSTQTITNGIDLSTKGGLVWIKNRTQAYNHTLVDTARGYNQMLESNTTSAQIDGGTSAVSGFSSSGFSIGAAGRVNYNGDNIVSWTFRKQAKFFDVVTYTGNGTTGRTISHNLGSVPGCIIIKCTSSASAWRVYHRSLTSTGVGVSAYLRLDSTNAVQQQNYTFGFSGEPTSTTFGVGNDGDVNASGGTYVAYLFAHDAGGFGASGSDNVISCGSFTTDGSGSATVNLGYEPQWVLIKNTDTATQWVMLDQMRGWSNSSATGSSKILYANTSNAEADSSSSFPIGYPTSTGFYVSNFQTSNSFIYIAIRRGPMRTPTSGTSVFKAVSKENGSPVSSSPVGVVDLAIVKAPQWNVDTQTYTTGTNLFCDRLRGLNSSGYALALDSTSTAAEASASSYDVNPITSFAQQAGVKTTVTNSLIANLYWMFRRAPGFFDVVCGTTISSSNQRFSHNLGVAPELIIQKARSTTSIWYVYAASEGVNKYLRLNTTAANTTFSGIWGAPPTTTDFGTDTGSAYGAGVTIVSYLFASCPGVSKVGSYTGTGTTKQIDCGFTGGARFVLIKRTDSTGDWYVWDSARGIVAGNDPYLLLNSTAAEVTNTDYVDTYSAGFEISSTAPAAINANGGSFIFLAIS